MKPPANNEITLRDSTAVHSATTRGGYPIRVSECSHSVRGYLWIVRTPYGIDGVVAADHIDAAHAAYLDDAPTVPVDDLPAAYGAADRAELVAMAGRGEPPDLIDGYHYQGNASGTGVVAVDHCTTIERLIRLDLDEVNLQIRGPAYE